MDLVAALRELDVVISDGVDDRSWLLRLPKGESYLVAPTVPLDRISAHAVRSIAFPRHSQGRPLIVGRTVTPNMLREAKAGHFDILTDRPLRLVLRGSVYETEDSVEAPARRRQAGRVAWVRSAVSRCLIIASEPLRQSVISDLLGTSQQSVSTAARQLGRLVESRSSGLSAVNKEQLLAHWMDDYAGPGGRGVRVVRL